MGDEIIDKGPGTEPLKDPKEPVNSTGITYIISIGIDKYNFDGIKDFNNNCAKDCKDFLAVLMKKYENCRPYKKKSTEPDCLMDGYATKDAIADRLKDFRASAENNISNNLIVYFSGHGEVVKISDDNQMGCLVPSGIEAMDAEYLVTYNDLKIFFQRLNVRHFLYIADACKSAAIFREAVSSQRTAEADTSGRGDKSKWAIVSSRANELSKAGKPGENSAFTSVLLRILQENNEKELGISTLVGSLDGRFSNEADGQKPYGGRLSIDQATNSGLFILRREDNSLIIDKRIDILKKKLRTFNYDDQRNGFNNIKKQKRSFTIFRGTPQCGLWHLAKVARQNAAFTISASNFKKLCPSITQLDSELFILGLFNSGLDTHFQTPDQLRAHLLKLLKDDDFALEIRYYSVPEKANPQIPPRFKKMILDRLADFISSINNENKDDKRLFLFVVDEEDCDYGTLYGNQKIAGIITNYIARVDPTKSTLDEIRNWYNRMKEEAQPDDKQHDINALFDEVLEENMETIFTSAKGFPGSFIRVVCEKAECADLANDILNPQ